MSLDKKNQTKWRISIVLPGVLLIMSGASIAQDTSENPQIRRLKARILTAEKRIEGYEKSIEKLNSDISKKTGEGTEATALQEKVDRLQKRKENAKSAIVSGEKQLENNRELVVRYQKAFQFNSDFNVGEKLGNIVLKSGRTLESVEIKELQFGKLRVAHAGGFAVVEFSELPESLADRVNVPPSTEPAIGLASISGDPAGAGVTTSGNQVAAALAKEKNQERSRAMEKRERMNEIATEIRGKNNDLKALIRRATDLQTDWGNKEGEMAGVIARARERRPRPSASDLAKMEEPYKAEMLAIKQKIEVVNQEITKVRQEIDALNQEMRE